MNDESSKQKERLNPCVWVALFAALASAVIVTNAFHILRTISDAGMWAIAAMAAAPPAIGIGMAYFMSRRPPPQ